MVWVQNPKRSDVVYISHEPIPLENRMNYTLFAYINRMVSTTILLMLTTKERLTDNQQIEAAYQSPKRVKEWKYIEEHHYSPYIEKRQKANQMAVD